jgi:very-short-patch-repair endonuclease
MMSPTSLSQFVSAKEPIFDLLIIDEASQMRPEEALTGLGRARQFIVVGDEQQLPPTSFFDAAVASDPGTDDFDEEETESVLELAMSVCQPVRELLFHYRSRHEDLIRFSNAKFYGDRLQIFPAAAQQAPIGTQLGVISHFVGGTYSSSENETEAREIVEQVLQHMRERPDWSLGVVAVNQRQAEAISLLTDQAILRDPAARAYLSAWADTTEPFFVKNLETVQGDERDVMMISTVYGPSIPGGPVMQRFGPINSVNGHRRLNVLVTRAKYRCEVFTSMRPQDVVYEPRQNRGVEVLKDYLRYAEDGTLEHPGHVYGGYDSPFEEAVAAFLRENGWQVETQVGAAGFRIDIAVVDPDDPRRFLTAVECDGASYHSAATARDRDIVRQAVLEDLGWSIYRIWSTDWFTNRHSEATRLLAHLTGLRTSRAGEHEDRDGHPDVLEHRETVLEAIEGWPSAADDVEDHPAVSDDAEAHDTFSGDVGDQNSATEASRELAMGFAPERETQATTSDGRLDRGDEQLARAIELSLAPEGRMRRQQVLEDAARNLGLDLTPSLRTRLDRVIAVEFRRGTLMTDWEFVWRASRR